MSKGASKPPAAPDPVKTTNAQAQINKDTALYQSALNNVNQITPYGNQTFTMTPYKPSASDTAAYQKALTDYNSQPAVGGKGGVWTDAKGGTSNRAPTQADFQSGSGAPTWTSTIQLSPAEQKSLDEQEKLQSQAQGVAGTALNQFQNNMATPYNLGGLSHQLANPNDVSNQENAVTQGLLSRLQPQFDRDQAALESRLANQGITQGSEAYKNAINLQNQAKNDAYTQAALSGVQAGQIYNNEALANNQQDVSNYNQQYYAPLNSYNSLSGGVQVQNPTFAGPQNTQVQPANYQQAVQNAYQANLNNYNAQTSSSNGMMNSLFSLGGSALGSVLGPVGTQIGGFLGSKVGNALNGGK